jgi:predicted small lipoprotein YifL
MSSLARKISDLRGLWLLLALALVSAQLSGCGKQGALETPSTAAAEQAGESGKKQDNAAAKSGSNQGEHKPFILDSLLR